MKKEGKKEKRSETKLYKYQQTESEGRDGGQLGRGWAGGQGTLKSATPRLAQTRAQTVAPQDGGVGLVGRQACGPGAAACSWH